MKNILILTSIFFLTACSQDSGSDGDTNDIADNINIVVDQGNKKEDDSVYRIDEKDMLITYSAGDLPLKVKREEHQLFADKERVANQMKANADLCGTTYEPDHFENLVDKFENTTSIQYGFVYDGEVQAPENFWVTLTPNVLSYTTVEEFRRDFEVCSSYQKSPVKLNEKWLMFVGNCGNGFDDGSGRPIGCQMIREQVEPTLGFK